MNTRLKQFLAAENISQSQFADTIKVVRASVSHVLSGRNKPGYDFITAIITAYPHLNIEWLMLGRGKMYKNTTTTVEVPSQPAAQNNEDNLPLLFEYDEEIVEVEPSPQSADPAPSPAVNPSAPTISSMNTFINTTQSAVKQRKVTKILVFFDDDTFQEIVTNK